MDEDINLYLTKKKLFLTMSTENTTLISVMLAYLALASPELGTAQPQLVLSSLPPFFLPSILFSQKGFYQYLHTVIIQENKNYN